MKNFKKILVAGLMAVSFSLTGCEKASNPPEECVNHFDANKDGKCDKCGADMPIGENQDFKGITFKSKTFTYDGLEHSLEVSGAPDFATVKYTNNNKINVGNYTVVATITAEGYNKKILNATLRIKNKSFEGITFDDLTVDYDGQVHSLEVKGAPDVATITYTGNDQKEAGSYDVSATVYAPNYETLNLSAKLTIKGQKFTGITFSNSTIEYDGKFHSLEAKGVPAVATVTYSGNGKKDVGTYTITAKISAPGYETLTLTATLTIKGKQFTGITFNDKEIAYDGRSHSIFVEGAPDFADVTYTGNGKSAKGTYTVTATIKAEGYETLVLTAKMTISNVLPKAILQNRTLIYNGLDQYVVFSLPDDLPRNTTASFKVDGKTVSEDNFKVKTVGTHNVSITLNNSDYASSTVNATVNVIQNFGGVDSSKPALTIDSSLKYQTLRQKIFEGNFTLKFEYIDDFYYPDGTEKHTLSSTTYYYMCGDELFEFNYSNEEFTEKPEYTSTTYRHTKFYGDEVKSIYFADGILDGDPWGNSYTMDGTLFQENIVGRTGLKALAWLNEAADGGFENGEEGGYHINYGSFKIDSANNCFVEDILDHYYHAEWNHDEHRRFTIYNIGNTKVDVPDVFNALKVDANFGEPEIIYKNGFHLYNKGDSYEINPILNAVSKAYLSPGTYEFPAEVCGKPVTSMDYGYYDPDIDMDLSGYTFKTYFDNGGYYKGEYASLGQLSGYRNIYQLEYDGATVLYYDEWH